MLSRFWATTLAAATVSSWLSQSAVSRMPEGGVARHLEGDRAYHRRKRGRGADGRAQERIAHVEMDFVRRHGQQGVPALAQGWGNRCGFALARQRGLEIGEEVVPEDFRRLIGEREAAPVVVERGVDDQAGTVAGRFAPRDIRQGGLAQQPLAQDLVQRQGARGRIDPAQAAHLAPEHGRADALADRLAVAVKKSPVGGCHRAVGCEHGCVAPRLLEHVVACGNAAARQSRQVVDLLEYRFSVR